MSSSCFVSCLSQTGFFFFFYFFLLCKLTQPLVFCISPPLGTDVPCNWQHPSCGILSSYSAAMVIYGVNSFRICSAVPWHACHVLQRLPALFRAANHPHLPAMCAPDTPLALSNAVDYCLQATSLYELVPYVAVKDTLSLIGCLRLFFFLCC